MRQKNNNEKCVFYNANNCVLNELCTIFLKSSTCYWLPRLCHVENTTSNPVTDIRYQIVYLFVKRTLFDGKRSFVNYFSKLQTFASFTIIIVKNVVRTLGWNLILLYSVCYYDVRSIWKLCMYYFLPCGRRWLIYFL